jgi:SAM-dependent methyltransferase
MAQLVDVQSYWEEASCGEELYLKADGEQGYHQHGQTRYLLEPYIVPFIDPEKWRNKKVLEVGVGLGADHELLARSGAILSGIDLTERAVEHTRKRFRLQDLTSHLQQGDAENLPFSDASFDLVYSWGVIHHSPNTPQAAREILRVLKPGGSFKVMIYHKWSLIGAMLWARYALLAGRPFTPLSEIYARYLESPGTKAYTSAEGAALLEGADVKTKVVLTHGDLLESAVGQRHRGAILSLARKVWPRWLLRRIAKNNGLFLLVDGQKHQR